MRLFPFPSLFIVVVVKGGGGKSIRFACLLSLMISYTNTIKHEWWTWTSLMGIYWTGVECFRESKTSQEEEMKGECDEKLIGNIEMESSKLIYLSAEMYLCTRKFIPQQFIILDGYTSTVNIFDLASRLNE